MIQKENRLLIDLSARLLYNVKCLVNFKGTTEVMTLKTGLPNEFGNYEFENEKCILCSNDFKPYLRSLKDMTEKEKWECIGFSRTKAISGIYDLVDFTITNPDFVDWLNSHFFDYRGLIEKGLAIRVTKENNPYKDQLGDIF